MACAGRHRYVAGGRLPRDDGRDAVSTIRTSPPGPSVRRKDCFRTPQKKPGGSGSVNLSLQLLADEMTREIRERNLHRKHSREDGIDSSAQIGIFWSFENVAHHDPVHRQIAHLEIPFQWAVSERISGDMSRILIADLFGCSHSELGIVVK
jgi:hypothetical protein